MSFEIDTSSGSLRATSGVHVSLTRCEPCGGAGCAECADSGWEPQGLGIWVQPVSAIAVQSFADQWLGEIRESVRQHAEQLGKKPHELTREERNGAPIRISEGFVEQLAHALESAFLRWDEGFVRDKAEPSKSYQPDDVIGERTALDLWVRYMCEHDTATVMHRILTAGSKRAVALEGNSKGPSAGTGATDEAQQRAEGPESTATDVPSADSPELPAGSAPTSAAVASPAST